MAKKTRRPLKGRRFTDAHDDGKIGSLARHIEKIYDLPKGSILFVKPKKKAMRRDATVGGLRRAWA